jgi:hypothetical protein
MSARNTGQLTVGATALKDFLEKQYVACLYKKPCREVVLLLEKDWLPGPSAMTANVWERTAGNICNGAGCGLYFLPHSMWHTLRPLVQ